MARLPLAFLGQSLGSRVSVSVNDRLPVKRMDMSINDTCKTWSSTLSSYHMNYHMYGMWGIILGAATSTEDMHRSTE